jgi:hypothetical protein
MANDITRIEATIFTLSAQFAYDDVNKKFTEPSPQWQDAFKNEASFYYKILKELAKRFYPYI